MKKKEYDEAQVLRLGRTLRRISRTTKDLMRVLDIHEDEVRIHRKKRKPKDMPSLEGDQA